MSLLPPSLDPLVMKVVAQPPVPSRDWQPPRSFNERLFTRPPQSACRSLRFVYYCRGGSSVDGISMEPSSTAFRRAVALLTIAASLHWRPPRLVRGGASSAWGVYRRSAPHVVRGELVNRHAIVTNHRRAHDRFNRHHRFGELSLPYAPYLVDTGEPPGAPVFADGDDVGAQVVPYERPVCVRPLIIKIKVRHAGHLPRVIYGRPPIC